MSKNFKAGDKVKIIAPIPPHKVGDIVGLTQNGGSGEVILPDDPNDGLTGWHANAASVRDKLRRVIDDAVDELCTCGAHSLGLTFHASTCDPLDGVDE